MKKMNIHEFIKYTRDNKEKYINYCEVIMDPYGNIILNEPSHTETVIKYAMKKENKTRDEIKKDIPRLCMPLEWYVDKYSLLAIWHCGYMYGSYKRKGPNRFQRRSLDLLVKEGLIIEDYVKPATEYGNYLYRKSLGYED